MLARIISVLALLSAAPPALALDACFAASVGPWRGPVWNGFGIQTMETEFHAGSDGMLVGHGLENAGGGNEPCPSPLRPRCRRVHRTG